MNTRLNNPLLRALDNLLEGQVTSWAINLFIIPFLVLLAIALPPLALPQRILSAGYSGIAANTGGSVSIADGAQFSVPPGALKSGASIRLTSQPPAAFLKTSLAKDLPPTLEVKSPLYQPSLQGQPPTQAVLSLPIPDDADPFATLDAYGYDGKKWNKLPFQFFIEEQRLEAYFATAVPQAVVLAQTAALAPTISADLTSKTTLPGAVGDLLAEVNPVGLTIADGGGIAGNIPALNEASAASPYQVLPTISNFDGDKVRGDLVDDMITTPQVRKEHIQALVDLAVEKLYPGLNIDYQDINPDHQKEFAAFIRELAQALRAKEKILSVTLALPDQKSADTWETGAYDWNAIGQAADIVKIPVPAREAFAGDPSGVETYLLWAVGRVDRYKLQLAFSVMGRDEFGNAYAPLAFASVAKLMGPVDVVPSNVAPDTKTTLDLPKLRESRGLKADPPSGLYSFTYLDDKQQVHTVWVESAESFAKKVSYALQYNLRGVALRDVTSDAMDTRAWQALEQYRDSKVGAFKARPVIVWRVNNQVVGKSPATDPRLTWTAPNQPGESKIEASLSFDDGQSLAGSTDPKPVQIAQAVPPTPTPRPTSAAPVATKPPAAPAAPASAFRGKNMFGYGIQVHGGDPNGEAADIKAMGFNWVKVQLPWKDGEPSKGNLALGSYDNFVNVMGSNGIKVLLSIVKAPRWSRTVNYSGGGHGDEGPPDNMQDAADFMGNVAARYCGKGVEAIEVWNEENLDVEWHDKRGLSAALYMDMLKRSYTTIKARCPGIAVISGAPTPNGLNNATAIDDVTWMHQLYQNGLKDYSDGIGAHPSGFRTSPLTAWTGASLGSFADHRSFLFRGTMDSYRAVMVQYGDANKQIWPTEFGWPVGTGGGAHPAGQYNNPNDVANYYAQAYQYGKQVGWVGAMFAWQLDFSGGEVGAFRIKGSPAFDALKNMPK
ncbi:MAG: glycosyl hydrolase family 18 protein [Anaerolineales bacterium]|nr:glycosyl hydrolase family 18 protein [Anaerolineales bacterium]